MQLFPRKLRTLFDGERPFWIFFASMPATVILGHFSEAVEYLTVPYHISLGLFLLSIAVILGRIVRMSLLP